LYVNNLWFANKPSQQKGKVTPTLSVLVQIEKKSKSDICVDLCFYFLHYIRVYI